MDSFTPKELQDRMGAPRPRPTPKPRNKELRSERSDSPRSALLYWHVANWFSDHAPGALVPDWCFMSWPIRDETVEEQIAMYESDTGRIIEDPPMPMGWDGP